MAHVDAQLEGAGGHHAAQSAALERLLDEGALFFGDGAVVRAGQRRHSLGGVHISLCFSVSPREFTKTIVERLFSIWSTMRSCTRGQMEVSARPTVPPAASA